MRVTATNMTVAEYCRQMEEKKIIVNSTYQRSNQVWPIAAKSFLIDTILKGFPIPKLSLYQKTDIRTRTTTKEIVDGQQRSHAVFDFFNDVYRVTSKGDFRGKNFSALNDDMKRHFMEYSLSVDVFVDATEPDIREMFRRMNSYNVPLNAQEKRHSTHQGPFKWFILEQSAKYAQILKDLGTFSESQLSRMEDARFIADICVGMVEGIVSASESKIDKLYSEYDDPELPFNLEAEFERRISTAMSQVLLFKEVLGDELKKKYQLYCLLLACMHVVQPIEALQQTFQSDGGAISDRAVTRLSGLAQAASTGEAKTKAAKDFILASSKTTDREGPRAERFKILCNLLK